MPAPAEKIIPTTDQSQETAAASLVPEPAPAQVAKGHLNLEIGNDYLLWSVTHSTPFKPQQLQNGAITGALLRDPVILGEELKRVLEDLGLTDGSVNLYLSLPEAMLRSLYVPVVPRRELTAVVLWEAEKVFPFPIQNELFDWRIVGTRDWGGSRKFQIQAAAVPAARVAPICDLLSHRGLHLQQVTLASHAWEPRLRELMQNTANPAKCCYALVRLLGNRLGVYCYYRGALEFVRESIIESAASEFEASFQYLDGAAPAPLQDALSHGKVDPQTIVEIVTDDLDYYYGRFSQRSVDTIILALPDDKFAPTSEALKAAIGVSVLSAFPDGRSYQTDGLLPPAQPKTAPLKFHWGKQRLDLLPRKYQELCRNRARAKAAVYAALLVMSVLAAVSAFQLISLAGLNAEERHLQGALNDLKNSEVFRQITTQINDQNIWQTQSAQLHHDAAKQSPILRALSVLTPPGIYLTTVNLQTLSNAAGSNSVAVSVNGFVVDDGRYPALQLAEYLKAIQSLSCCSNVELANQYASVSDLGKQLNFDIALEMTNCGN